MKRNLPLLSNKYLFFFAKGQGVRYISHLDLMRTFERALRRSDLPLAYTEGFNPRIRLSFALPLPVGVEAEHDPALLELRQYVSPEVVIEQLNRVLPPEITVSQCCQANMQGGLTSLVRHAAYLVQFAETIDTAGIERMLARQHLVYIKKTKSQQREVDLKEHLLDCAYTDHVLTFTVSAGEGINIRPDEVVSLLCPGLTPVRIVRTRLFLDFPFRI